MTDEVITQLEEELKTLNGQLQEVSDRRFEAAAREREIEDRIYALDTEFKSLDLTDYERIRLHIDLSNKQRLQTVRRRQRLVAMGVMPEELARRPRRRR